MASPRVRLRAKAGSSALRRVPQLVALGAHAGVRQARLLEVAVAIGIRERPPGPDEEAPADRILVLHRPEGAVIARPAQVGLAPRVVLALLAVFGGLLRRGVGLRPLHGRAAASGGEERDEGQEPFHVPWTALVRLIFPAEPDTVRISTWCQTCSRCPSPSSISRPPGRGPPPTASPRSA